MSNAQSQREQCIGQPAPCHVSVHRRRAGGRLRQQAAAAASGASRLDVRTDRGRPRPSSLRTSTASPPHAHSLAASSNFWSCACTLRELGYEHLPRKIPQHHGPEQFNSPAGCGAERLTHTWWGCASKRAVGRRSGAAVNREKKQRRGRIAGSGRRRSHDSRASNPLGHLAAWGTAWPALLRGSQCVTCALLRPAIRCANSHLVYSCEAHRPPPPPPPPDALEEGPAAGAGQALRCQRLVEQLLLVQQVLLLQVLLFQVLILWALLVVVVVKLVLLGSSSRCGAQGIPVGSWSNAGAGRRVMSNSPCHALAHR